MGSLMAGWDSPVLMDPDTVKLDRNKSLTNEEIDSFWRLHPNDEPSSPLSPRTFKNAMKSKEGSMRCKKSNFWKSLAKSESVPSSPPESPVEGRENKTEDWWTMSNWAFLNEPPLDEINESAHKYTPQFHVAQITTK